MIDFNERYGERSYLDCENVDDIRIDKNTKAITYSYSNESLGSLKMIYKENLS